MNTLFTPDFFKQNRKRLRESLDTDAPIIITSNGLLQRNNDNPYPYRQDSSFWYLAGINMPDITLVMSRDHEYLITQVRQEIHERFDGVLDCDELTRISGVAEVLGEKEGWRQLNEVLKRQKSAATLLPAPAYIPGYNMYANPARQRILRRLRRAKSGLEVVDIRQQVARLRVLKQVPELTAIQNSINITVSTLQDILRPEKWQSYAFEYEIAADLVHGYRRAGAESLSFDPIVSGGIRACTFHNMDNNNPLADGELVVIDTGAEAQHYASDITRTVAYGMPTDRQRAVHGAVLESQEYGISLLKPGMTFKEWDQKVRAYVGQKLIALGLITTADAASIARYYPHYSHFLGLDVHDAGDYSQPFMPGMVLTCEPGIYIPEEGIGVRIEDDILITEKGHEVLSDALPRQLYPNA